MFLFGDEKIKIMEHINLTNILAFLGFLSLIISFVGVFKKGEKIPLIKVFFSLLIGLLILLITIKKNSIDKESENESKNHFDSLSKVIISLSKKHEKEDSIHRKSDSIHGLKFDTISNTLMIIDSQLLKRFINYKPVYFDEPLFTNAQLNKVFDEIKINQKKYNVLSDTIYLARGDNSNARKRWDQLVDFLIKKKFKILPMHPPSDTWRGVIVNGDSYANQKPRVEVMVGELF